MIGSLVGLKYCPSKELVRLVHPTILDYEQKNPRQESTQRGLG